MVLNSPIAEILLISDVNKTFNLPKARNLHDLEDLLFLDFGNLNTLFISFQNNVTIRDTLFLQKKRKQFKQKQFEKIYKGAKKILGCYPNYLLAYLFAGASAFKLKKHENSGAFYLSCAALNNPNCLSAWDGLKKFCRDNCIINDVIFETVFCGYLLNERKPEKWGETVAYLLSDEIPTSKHLFFIFARFFQPNYGDHSKALFMAEALSLYLFRQVNSIKKTTNICDQVSQLAVEAFVINCDDPCKEGITIFYNEALTYFLHTGAYRCLVNFLSRTFNVLTTLSYNKTEFLISIFNLIFLNNLDPSFDLYQKLACVVKSTCILDKLTANKRVILSLISKSFSDHKRKYYRIKKYTREGRFNWMINVVSLWSNINLQDFELVWKRILKALSGIVPILNENESMTLLEKRNVAQLHLDLCLYLLTHCTNKLMQIQGLILCLKLLKENCNRIQLFYYASVASIGLNAMNVFNYCLHKLSYLGAIKEVLFLRSLVDVSYSSRTLFLKEIQELRNTHLLAAMLSNKYENRSKALKSFCKASVKVPDSWPIYEWLGIYFYENHDTEKSKLYFELALFYNPHSWTSINYYANLLALDDPASSKLFLSLYINEREKNLSFLHWVDIKAGLSFFNFQPRKDDYLRACEYFRRCLRRDPQNRYFKEMVAEAYSKFGMIGSSLQCFKECYLIYDDRHMYSGSMLGKQLLFVKGVTKYLNMMKRVANNGGMDAYIVLHNTAHALLLKSIKLSARKHNYLSQVYCQQALFFCVRALSITTSFSGIWKLMGDILFQCSSLNYSSGFIYVPSWLIPEYASTNIILIRRFQSCLLAIRCYYAGLNAEFQANEMRVCLWNSIAVGLRKLSSFGNMNLKKKIINFGVQCSAKSLKINIYDSMSWNILGVLLNDQGLKIPARKQSYEALQASITLSSPVAYSLFSTCNAGFVALSLLEFQIAYKLFLSARGTYSSLDIPWVGDMLINLLVGNLPKVIQNIIYLNLLTKHSPGVTMAFKSLLLLSPFASDELISYLGKKYKCYTDADNIYSKSYLLSGMVKLEGEKYKNALIDFVFAIRTYFSNNVHDHETYHNAVLQGLLICLHKNKSKLSLDVEHYVHKQLGTYLLCGEFLNEVKLESAFLELIKGLKSENRQNIKKMMYSLLFLVCYIGDQKNYSKYYFHKRFVSNC